MTNSSLPPTTLPGLRARLTEALEPLMIVNGGYTLWYHLARIAAPTFHQTIPAHTLSLRLAPFVEIADCLAACEAVEVMNDNE